MIFSLGMVFLPSGFCAICIPSSAVAHPGSYVLRHLRRPCSSPSIQLSCLEPSFRKKVQDFPSTWPLIEWLTDPLAAIVRYVVGSQAVHVGDINV